MKSLIWKPGRWFFGLCALGLAAAAGGGPRAQSGPGDPGARQAAEAFAEAVEPTQAYLSRRAVALLARRAARGGSPSEISDALARDARRLAPSGPSAADIAALDAEIAREGEALLTAIERRAVSGAPQWPRNKPATVYVNGTLIMVAALRRELAEAVARRVDPLPVMRRADAVSGWADGYASALPPAIDHFSGRDALVRAAIETIRVAAPARPADATPPPGPAVGEGVAFPRPQINGVDVDWCATFAQGCGQPGADQFCRTQGFARASRWSWVYADRTFVIGSANLCAGAGRCGALRDVVCSSAAANTFQASGTWRNTQGGSGRWNLTLTLLPNGVATGKWGGAQNAFTGTWSGTTARWVDGQYVVTATLPTAPGGRIVVDYNVPGQGYSGRWVSD